MDGHLRRIRIVAVAAVALSMGLAGCVGQVGSGGNPDKLHQQAQADLSIWADAVASLGPSAFVPVGDLTGQIGDWEASVGDNNKPALMAGMVEWTDALPDDTPPDGQVLWQDGSSAAVQLISARAAISEVKSEGSGSCTDCTPLQITGARLTIGSVETSRGLAQVPIWEFTVQGTAVLVTRVAIDARVSVSQPPMDSNAPYAIAVESATISADGTQLTVTFTGAPGPASQSCGADYTAEAVESSTAVVVIVTEHKHAALFEACALAGAERTAVAQLAAPLGGRAVLEVTTGQPVAVEQSH
jgi:hypothetical protein